MNNTQQSLYVLIFATCSKLLWVAIKIKSNLQYFSLFTVYLSWLCMIFFLPYKGLQSLAVLFSLNSLGPPVYICSALAYLPAMYIIEMRHSFSQHIYQLLVCTQFVWKNEKYLPVVTDWFSVFLLSSSDNWRGDPRNCMVLHICKYLLLSNGVPMNPFLPILLANCLAGSSKQWIQPSISFRTASQGLGALYLGRGNQTFQLFLKLKFL